MFYTFLFSLLIFISSCFAVEEKYIPTENATLFCRIVGTGKPVIVIHGGAGYLTQDYLLPHMEVLAGKHCIVFYDQRGLGKSTGEITSEQINLKTYVDDIESIRKFLGVRKISLIGHSFGGLLAMLYALSYPESIEQMILSNSMVATSDDLSLFFAELSRRTASFQKEIQDLETSADYLSGDSAAVMDVNRLYYQTYMYDPELVNKLNLCKTQKENINGAKVWEFFKHNVFIKPYNLLSELKKVQCSTLIIHGNEDVVPLLSSEHIHNVIPNSKFVKIEKCGHFPFVEQLEAFFKAIEDFLN